MMYMGTGASFVITTDRINNCDYQIQAYFGYRFFLVNMFCHRKQHRHNCRSLSFHSIGLRLTTLSALIDDGKDCYAQSDNYSVGCGKDTLPVGQFFIDAKAAFDSDRCAAVALLLSERHYRNDYFSIFISFTVCRTHLTILT